MSRAKLMQDGRRPVAVGFFFSLGHSTVVILASVALAATATALQGRFEAFKAIGGLIGTIVSASFLLVIAVANILVLLGVYKAFRRGEGGWPLRGGGSRSFARRARPPQPGSSGRCFAMIGRSWHMYPLGFLFGLGFDTATEIGVLGLSATGAAQGLSIWSIMVFPALFTAGMTLVRHHRQRVLMLGAYGWAFVKPIRKLYYNMTITFVSIVVALVVGRHRGAGAWSATSSG